MEKDITVAVPAKLNTFKIRKFEDQSWENDASYTLTANTISRAKKVLNRAQLKQSVLVHEILRKKY